jgi:cation:H+ antiporter
MVSGSVSIARKYKISEITIGLTIVSFGTSMPELIINIISSYSGSSEIAIGNVIGSNISNILLILGITAIICELPLKNNMLSSEIPFSLMATLLVGYLANATFFGDTKSLFISHADGAIFLLFFILFMIYVYTTSKESQNEETGDETETDEMSNLKAITLIVSGMFGLFLGGKFVVDGAIEIAKMFGMSETFIGLTVVAIGTSLPELVTSVMAALKKSTDIAIGNVIGSNIFNLLWILGISASIKPLPFKIISNDDIAVLLFATLLMLFAPIASRKKFITKKAGWFFLFSYIAYTVYLINRG